MGVTIPFSFCLFVLGVGFALGVSGCLFGFDAFGERLGSVWEPPKH